MQIAGSKNARLGVLFNAELDAESPGLLFVKFFQITASSYRSVYIKQYMNLLQISSILPYPILTMP